MSLPVVSCIMPTYNRRRFIPKAIEYFLRQDYPNRELIIVDDGTDPIGDLVPADRRIRYQRYEGQQTIGAKRNLACREARGEIIVHWDDDDWMAPWRLSYQVESLLSEQADICGIDRLFYYEPASGKTWQYIFSKGGKPWIGGGTFCYTKTFWRQNAFSHINVGEDNDFLENNLFQKMLILQDCTFYVALVHPQNTSPKHTADSQWHAYPTAEIRDLLGKDWIFYQLDQAREINRLQNSLRHQFSTCERNVSMIAMAREDDLDLPEFSAFNHGQALPRMRRWELPFALFQSRLSNTMSLLDCTINPVNFRKQLTRLYPHTLYRYWNPIQEQQFVLPFGVPDEAFDRVICVNTLEHLLRPQRKALIDTLARKLKPGGLLVLTSDYYFDRFWEDPAFLQAGVMQEDRKETFNGWNKVTLREWLDLCSKHDLHPMAEAIEEPREDDSTLYRNQPPYPHACIGGVFSKSRRVDFPRGKKIVLGLLTWNTCDVSLDSVYAYIKEARMLQRLGQTPLICICDNGSTDGTADALGALEAKIDLPHRFIFNKENLGNSIARNQIIDYMLECDADYLLFMDGDIEIVPFSSFAMLRYMENNGHRLGCIGADSAGQSPSREQASSSWYSIDNHRVETTNLVAWTQYGMFRRTIFEDGIRFDETEPFDRVGWGFEDNDLAFQMEIKGYLNQRFFGMTYLHRNVQSSMRIMKEQNIDPSDLYRRRKHYMLDKWASVPPINDGPLQYVRQVNIPIADRPGGMEQHPTRTTVNQSWATVLKQCQDEVAAMCANPYYASAYREAERLYWHQIPAWIYTDVSERKPENCLDIGCAYGTLLLYVHLLSGCRSDATDFTDKYISQSLLEKYGLHFAVNNIELDDFPWDCRYDIVIFTEILEHLNFYAVPTLQKVRSLLSENGRLYLSAPDASEWGQRTDYYPSYRALPMPSPEMRSRIIDDHVWHFNRDELFEVVQDAGLEILRFDFAPGSVHRHFNLTLRSAQHGNGK